MTDTGDYNNSELELTAACYGRTKVRGVFRVARHGKWHDIMEYNVGALLKGELRLGSYTAADNSNAKNITCLLAKTSPHILSAEKYALQLGTFFVSKYTHIAKTFVTIEHLRWSQNPDPCVDGSAGKDKLVGKVPAGIIDLLVLKYAGSAFENFYRDEYTTLVEVNDKSSSPPSTYTMCSPLFPYERPTDEKKVEFMAPLQKGEEGHAGSAALETFAVDESASVQATLYNMVQHVFAENASVRSVSYALPNKHYIPVDMRYLNIDNLTLYVEHLF
ncbi:tetrahydrobiopterin biosynthesis enzymes-like protein [Agrocybe pediades]|nr:tetrahydrobiopterin biosynthesis enzymes-like protein [Agrocybe pediades]